MVDSTGWKLVNSETGRTVLPGVELLDFKGEEWRIDMISRLPEGNSTGRVTCSRPWQGERPHWAADRDRDIQEVYPSVFRLEIVKDIPQAEQDIFAQLSEEMSETAEEIGKAMAIEAIRQGVEATGHSAACIIGQSMITHMVQSLSSLLNTALGAAEAYGRAYPDDRHEC